jgi:hypothetical protein
LPPPVPTTPTHLHVPGGRRDRGLRPLAGLRAFASVAELAYVEIEARPSTNVRG